WTTWSRASRRWTSTEPGGRLQPERAGSGSGGAGRMNGPLPAAPSMAIHDSILELVGDTPVIRARRLDTGPCTLYLKLESQNPGGSIKDRIGLSMIEAAERRGDIKPGATLVE